MVTGEMDEKGEGFSTSFRRKQHFIFRFYMIEVRPRGMGLNQLHFFGFVIFFLYLVCLEWLPVRSILT